MDRQRTSDRAFTLVELLVVIAIIAVLIAMLLPVLSKVKRQAMEVRCATNLRQLGQVQMIYLQEYNCYPDARFELTQIGNGGGGWGVAWPARLRKLVRANRTLFYCPAQDPRCQWNDDNPGRVIYAEEVHTQFGYDVGERILVEHYPLGSWFSYGVNMEGSGTVGSPGRGVGAATYGDFHSPHIIHFQSRRPGAAKPSSNFIVMADTIADSLADFTITPRNPGGGTGLNSEIASIHRGGANVLFGDGHVQWMRPDDVRVTWFPAVPEEAPKQCMWNIDNKPSVPFP
jgi:prepilin-type N-terminal cleavage/methylation domain-containing protein/prepilin-type processing-associated H-X9-DG protein